MKKKPIGVRRQQSRGPINEKGLEMLGLRLLKKKKKDTQTSADVNHALHKAEKGYKAFRCSLIRQIVFKLEMI